MDDSSVRVGGRSVQLITAALATLSEVISAIGSVVDTELVEVIEAVEILRRKGAAVQAHATHALRESITRNNTARGIRDTLTVKSINSMVALARRSAPNQGGRQVGAATALVTEMPHTLAALTAGRIDDWAATSIVRETAILSAEHRRAVDDALAELFAKEGVGHATLVRSARAHAQRLDPAAAVQHARKVRADRRVSVRPAPDTMAYLTALLPVEQAVAVYATLRKIADQLLVAGDTRSRDQIMADTLHARVTGASSGQPIPVSVHLVLSDRTLFGEGDEPASIPGHGPIPAWLARTLIAAAVENDQAWLRRLYTEPGTGVLVATDSVARAFPRGLARLIRLRDQTCAAPFCDAPIQHIDHIKPVAEGGLTALANGQGLCAHCNYLKEHPDWSVRPDGPDITWRTPTGQTYRHSPTRVLPGQQPA